MAIEQEQEIMRIIDIDNHYNYYNGSKSCGFIRRKAIKQLPVVLEKKGLSLSEQWAKAIKLAEMADSCLDDSTLTNTWVACSYAIQDAIYRKYGNNGIPAKMDFLHFWDDKHRNN